MVASELNKLSITYNGLGVDRFYRNKLPESGGTPFYIEIL